MRILLAVGWLMIPVAVAAWHYGPGQDYAQLDDVARILAAAQRQIAEEDWAGAVETYEEALKRLPANRAADARRLRLERDKAQMLCGKLPEAHADLKNLVEELSEDSKADPKLFTEARSALASSQYYLTWLMRLEGEPRQHWEPEIEAARQTYRLLAEEADARKDPEAGRKCREDLEASIRLARMDPAYLQGLSLPCQCQGCCSGKCSGKKPGRTPNKARERKDARGASAGLPPDGSGH